MLKIVTLITALTSAVSTLPTPKLNTQSNDQNQSQISQTESLTDSSNKLDLSKQAMAKLNEKSINKVVSKDVTRSEVTSKDVLDRPIEIIREKTMTESKPEVQDIGEAAKEGPNSAMQAITSLSNLVQSKEEAKLEPAVVKTEEKVTGESEVESVNSEEGEMKMGAKSTRPMATESLIMPDIELAEESQEVEAQIKPSTENSESQDIEPSEEQSSKPVEEQEKPSETERDSESKQQLRRRTLPPNNQQRLGYSLRNYRRSYPPRPAPRYRNYRRSYPPRPVYRPHYQRRSYSSPPQYKPRYSDNYNSNEEGLGRGYDRRPPHPIYRRSRPVYQSNPRPIYQSNPRPIYQSNPRPIYQSKPRPLYRRSRPSYYPSYPNRGIYRRSQDRRSYRQPAYNGHHEYRGYQPTYERRHYSPVRRGYNPSYQPPRQPPSWNYSY